MNAWLAIPFELQLLLLAAAGAAAGGLVNWLVLALALEPRPLSPWSRAHPRDQRSVWADRLPVWGWLRLRRKQKQLGYDFWVRPLVVEVLAAAIVAGLYWWEVGEAALVMPPLGFVPPGPALLASLHAQFALHALLAMFMLAASLVDLQDRIIPDEVTVPGTLVALVGLALLPQARLIDIAVLQHIRWLEVTSPEPIAAKFVDGPLSLAVGLACFWAWCLALLPRVWRSHRGWRLALGLLWARIVRERFSYLVLALFVLGTAGVLVVWGSGGRHWIALFSSLVGLAVGGGLVWYLRIFGKLALRREAMGFGDVTLMAMIGAFLGWQPALLVFFLAPCAALVIGLVRYFLRREHEIPYGPFLCLATLVVLWFWPDFWDRVQGAFALGWLVPTALAICLVLIIALLALLGLLKRLFTRAAG